MNAITHTEHVATEAAHAAHNLHSTKSDQKNADWHARRLAATPRSVGVMGNFFVDHARNSEFWDIEAIAASHAVLDIMAEEGLVERANVLGERLLKHLEGRKALDGRISDVRGLGAMVACEFANPLTGTPDMDLTQRVQTEALRRGLLLLTCGVHGNVVRFLFPLTIQDHVFAEALGILDAALDATQHVASV